MDKTQQDLTQELIEARKNQNISQRELAKRAGTTQAVISRVENLDVNPSIGLLDRISEALGQSLNISTSPTVEKIKHKLVGEYQTLNLITINSEAFQANFDYFQKENPQSQISPVVKSNAYGHGLLLVGKWIDNNLQVPFISVDSLHEAYELKNSGVKTPILVMGYTHPSNFAVFTNLSNIHFSVFDQDTLQALNKYQPQANIHIKIDTGMNRLGLLPNHIESFINTLKQYPNLNVSGILSHFSQADVSKKYTAKQIDTFKNAIRQFESKGYAFNYKHIAATAGSFITKDPEFNVIRIGLGLYGYSPSYNETKSPIPELKTKIQPVLRLTSKIAQIKTVGEGSAISYGGTHITKKQTKLAILPIGYYDGLSRELSNKGFVYIKEQACPIIGNISMNQTIVDISKLKNAKVGDEAEVISPNPNHSNSVYQLAMHQDTIPYTILTSLTETTKRKVI